MNYSFSTDDPMRGWMVLDTFSAIHQGAVSDNTDMTMTLNGAWEPKDSNLGFYINSNYKAMAAKIPQCMNTNAYLIMPQANWTAKNATTFTFTLNCSTIRNPYTGRPLFGAAPNSYSPMEYYINGWGGIDNATFLFDASQSGCLKLNISDITLNQHGDLYMIDGRGGFSGSANLTNCSGTYEKDGVYPNIGVYGDVFSYTLRNCSFSHA